MGIKIHLKDISVVVQGAISKEFSRNALKSVRKHLPDAEIILSTWIGSDVAGLDYDELVENEDPGAEVLHEQWGQKHNLNRQIVSTKNGIKRATRQYVLKIRTDIALTGNGFLEYFDKFQKRNDYCKCLEKRVITCQYYARLAHVLPFHPGDWVFFGLRDDVLKIWDIPLAPEPETTKWFYDRELVEQHKSGPYSHFRHRFCAEQYIWSSFLRKYMPLDFEHMFDTENTNIFLTRLSFANNLVIISDKAFCIEFLKNAPSDEPDLYNYSTWLELYREFCDPNVKVPIMATWHHSKCQQYLDKSKKHWGYFLAPFRAIGKWLCSLIATNLYLYKAIGFISKKFILSDGDVSADIREIKKIFNKLDLNNKVKQVNVLHCNIGESYIFANVFNIIEKMYSPNETVWVTTSGASKAVFDLLAPDNKLCLTRREKFHWQNSSFEFRDKQVRIFFGNDFWHVFWLNQKDFYRTMIDKYNLTEVKFKRPAIDKAHATSLEMKMAKAGLNVNNFVFLSPEANSMELLPKAFWNTLAKILISQDYDVFCNIMDKDNHIEGAKSCYLNLAEAYLLASQAKMIVGLRSGFTEILSISNVTKHIIYNLAPSKKIPSSLLRNFFENYSLTKYPNVDINTLFEHKHYLTDDLDEILSRITKIL